MADPFQIGVGTVNHHLKAIFAEGELPPGATIRRYRIVQDKGICQIAREVEHYWLEDLQPQPLDADFNRAVKQLRKPPEKKP